MPPTTNKCPGYDTKADNKVPVMLELWGIQSAHSLLLPPGSLWPGVVASERIVSMGQINLNYVLMLNRIA